MPPLHLPPMQEPSPGWHLIWGKLELKHKRHRLQSGQEQVPLTNHPGGFHVLRQVLHTRVDDARPSSAGCHSLFSSRAPLAGSVEAFPSYGARARRGSIASRTADRVYRQRTPADIISTSTKLPRLINHLNPLRRSTCVIFAE